MRCRFFRCYFITSGENLLGMNALLKLLTLCLSKDINNIMGLVLMMSLLNGHKGSVLQCLQERSIGWNTFIDTNHHPPTSLQCASRIFVLYTCLHMYCNTNTHLQVSQRPRVSVFRAEKVTDLSLAWMDSFLSAWAADCLYIYQFRGNAQFSCLCLCFSFACWLGQNQRSGFLFCLDLIGTFKLQYLSPTLPLLWAQKDWC